MKVMRIVWSGLIAAVCSISTVAFAAKKQLPPLAPDFPRHLPWINSPELSLKELAGKKIALVTFINVSSLNSIRTFSILNAWQDHYAGAGFTVVGVHTPDFSIDRDAEHLQSALNGLKVRFPVVVDNEHILWDAYQNKGWPAMYLIDRERLVYSQMGEGGYRHLEEVLILALEHQSHDRLPRMEPIANDPSNGDCGAATIPFYLGSQRGKQQYIQAVPKNEILTTSREGEASYHGAWQVEAEDLRYDSKNKKLQDFFRVIYRGAEAAGLMASTAGKPIEVLVKQDELWLHPINAGPDIQWDKAHRSYVAVAEPRIYHLTRNKNDSMHALILTPLGSGAEILGFDFSNQCQIDYGRQ